MPRVGFYGRESAEQPNILYTEVMEERRCWVDSIKSRCATCAPIRAACRRIVVLYGIAIISFATCRHEGEGGGYDTRSLIPVTPSAEYDLPLAPASHGAHSRPDDNEAIYETTQIITRYRSLSDPIQFAFVRRGY